jgi:hypothetical protein
VVAWPVSTRYKELKVFIKSVEVTKNLAEKLSLSKVCTIVGFIFITVSVSLNSLLQRENSHPDSHSFVQSLVPFLCILPISLGGRNVRLNLIASWPPPSVFVPPGIMLQSSGLSITGTYFFRSCWEFPPCHSLAVYFVIMEKTFGHLLLCKLKTHKTANKNGLTIHSIQWDTQ